MRRELELNEESERLVEANIEKKKSKLKEKKEKKRENSGASERDPFESCEFRKYAIKLCYIGDSFSVFK